MKSFDYNHACSIATEMHVLAMEAHRKKVSSPGYTQKQYITDRIEEIRRDHRVRQMVYFLRESGAGYIKIGTSINVGSRIRDLGRGTPHELELLTTMPGGHAVEALVHELFAHARRVGEWFKPVPELLEYITEVEFLRTHCTPVREGQRVDGVRCLEPATHASYIGNHCVVHAGDLLLFLRRPNTIINLFSGPRARTEEEIAKLVVELPS